MTAQSESEISLGQNLEQTLSLPISMYDSIKTIDSQVGFDITRTIYYSQYKIYRSDFSTYLNLNNDVLKYSGNINDHDNKLFEDIIQYPDYDFSKNSSMITRLVSTGIGDSLTFPLPVLNIMDITQILSTYNINTIYSYKIYTYIQNRIKNLNLNNLNSLNQNLLKPNTSINLIVTDTRYQVLANYISNIVVNNLSDIDFTAELQKQMGQIIKNQQTFLYAQSTKPVLLGHNVILSSGGNIYVVMTPQIVYSYCVDLLIRKKKTYIILKNIFDDLKINYTLQINNDFPDIDTFYNYYTSQNYSYIDNPANIKIATITTSPTTPISESISNNQNTVNSETKSSTNFKYILWGISSSVSLIIIILIIVLIKIL